MSNPNGPIRRRRIAGESKQAVEPAESKRKLIPQAPRKAAGAKPVSLAKSLAPKGTTVSTKGAATKVAPAAPPLSPKQAPMSTRAKIALPPRTEWRWLIPLTLVTIAAVVFGAVFAVKGITDFRDQRGIDGSNTRAAAAAGSAAETIFSFQYNKLDVHLTQSKALMTTSFKKEFEKIAPALTALAPQRKIQVRAQSRNAAALECGTECSPAKASILVFLDQARLVGDSKVPTVFANRIIVDMVERNGNWLVNDITAL